MTRQSLPIIQGVCNNGHQVNGQIAWLLPLVFSEDVPLTRVPCAALSFAFWPAHTNATAIPSTAGLDFLIRTSSLSLRIRVGYRAVSAIPSGWPESANRLSLGRVHAAANDRPAVPAGAHHEQLQLRPSWAALASFQSAGARGRSSSSIITRSIARTSRMICSCSKSRIRRDASRSRSLSSRLIGPRAVSSSRVARSLIFSSGLRWG